MSIDRIKRVNEMIRRELSLGLFHVGHGEGLDLARISIVDVDVSRDLRSASVAVSIMAPEAESHAYMAWLHRHRAALQSHIAKTVSIKYTPRLTFRKTHSIEQGDRVLALLDEILLGDSESTATDAIPANPTGEAPPDER
ncbi:MAG: 30S ribosome-binding factor RbfA [Kiritimatiellia bacterium]|jgi:ribosome-binding factor A